MHEIVSQYQKVFDILWEKAIPVKERIKEIEAFEERIVKAVISRKEEKYTLSNSAVNSQPPMEPSSEHKRLKESIEKETEALLDTRIPDYNKNPPHTSVKIQLWSNNSKTDYAIKLKGKSDFLAATRQDTTEEYTHLVEESDYLEDVQYDWNYTLRHWIDNHASNIISEFTDIASVFTGTSNFARGTKGDDNEIYNSPIFREIQNKTFSHQKGTFKCNYCRLMFNNKINRKRHEQEWHTTTNPGKMTLS
jgi:hypothetical protein